MFTNENELIEYLLSCQKNKNYEDALKSIEDNFDLISKKYYEVIKLKIIFLLETDKLIDASVLIKEELSVPYIPKDFESFLHEKRKEVMYRLKDKERHQISIEDMENIDKLDGDSLLNLLPHFSDFNLGKLTNKIQNIFLNNEISNVVKTLLIATLSDYKLDHEFSIVKEGISLKFNPSEIQDIRESDNFIYIMDELKKFKDVEINAMELIKRLIVTYLIDIYPLKLTKESCDELIASVINMTNLMLNCNINLTKYNEILTNRKENIEKISKKINYLIESI